MLLLYGKAVELSTAFLLSNQIKFYIKIPLPFGSGISAIEKLLPYCRRSKDYRL
jgi:hypothetical protein